MLLQAMRRIDADRRGLTSAVIVEKAKVHDDLRCAVEDLAGKLDSRILGYSLRSFLRRNFDGWFLDKATTTAQGARWIARPMSEFRQRPSSPGDEFQPHRSGDDGDRGDVWPHAESKNRNDGLFDEPTELPD